MCFLSKLHQHTCQHFSTREGSVHFSHCKRCRANFLAFSYIHIIYIMCVCMYTRTNIWRHTVKLWKLYLHTFLTEKLMPELWMAYLKKYITVRLQYVKEKVTFPECWKAASNRDKQFPFLLHSKVMWAKSSFCRLNSYRHKCFLFISDLQQYEIQESA